MNKRRRHALVKVGGSLYDLPDLAARLRTFVERLGCPRVTLYPGGGAAADAVRAMDAVHRVGEESAHWLALRALTLNAFFLGALLPEFAPADGPDLPDRAVLEPHAFALADEKNTDRLPHTWAVTSDSLAARAAHLLGASEFIMLKSTPLPDGMSWQEAARAGLVDEHFPKVLEQGGELKVSVVDFRTRSS